MKFEIQLWHAKQPTFQCPTDLVVRKFREDYNLVHVFELEAETARAACEAAFEQSQNMDEAWKAPNRSTSVGDIMVIPRVGVYAVDNVGMRDLLEMGTQPC